MSETLANLIERQADVVVVHVQAKDLDVENSRQLQEEIFHLVDEGVSVPVVLDMSRVKFMPSMSLSTLVRIANDFRKRNQRLMLASLQPTIRHVVAITRLDRLFEVYDDVVTARTNAQA